MLETKESKNVEINNTTRDFRTWYPFLPELNRLKEEILLGKIRNGCYKDSDRRRNFN